METDYASLSTEYTELRASLLELRALQAEINSGARQTALSLDYAVAEMVEATINAIQTTEQASGVIERLAWTQQQIQAWVQVNLSVKEK